MSIANGPIHPVRTILYGSLAILALSLAPAWAGGGTGGPPGIDHYLVYRAPSGPPFPGGYSFTLLDQFSPIPSSYVASYLEFFANPVSKNGEGIVDPNLHYTWWHLTPQTPVSGTVIATNQFGDQELQLRFAYGLLNPALKYPSGPPFPPLPAANHYKCYAADGPFVSRFVTLDDQFGPWQAQVIRPVMWCNPTEKDYQGHVEPILRPDAHLVCYQVQVTPGFSGLGITFLDEFTFGDIPLSSQVFLCVPTYKQNVVPVEPSSWGSVKAIYR